MRKLQSLPPDDEHLIHLSNVQTSLLTDHSEWIDASDPALRLLSVSLSAVYEAATCHRVCHGGPHVLESILGRAYNLAVGAWILVRVAQYDEALNLIRGLGEINNLLMLFAYEPDLISAWLTSTKKARMNAFSPVHVRRKLSKHVSLPAGGDDWYAALCEGFVHVHPGTRPNKHTHGMAAQMGPVIQEDGKNTAIDELRTIVFSIALAACKWFRFDETFAKLSKLTEQLISATANSSTEQDARKRASPAPATAHVKR